MATSNPSRGMAQRFNRLGQRRRHQPAACSQYLCDRANPPIPCELVRGHLDYTPHALDIVPVKKRNGLVRMIVDACYPTNIKEETDPEYFC
ncbi:hypothetical protein ACJX0J_041553, partial [Zea mays]